MGVHRTAPSKMTQSRPNFWRVMTAQNRHNAMLTATQNTNPKNATLQKSVLILNGEYTCSLDKPVVVSNTVINVRAVVIEMVDTAITSTAVF